MFKKNKGRYSDEKQHKTNRDVMSYEDVPLDDYEQEKTEMSPKAVKKIIIAVCVALAAGLIVFAFANRDKLTWENISNWWTYDVLGNGGSGYPVDIVGSEVSSGNFVVTQGHCVYASDTSFVTLSGSGVEAANLQLSHSKPIMRSSGNRFLTFGLGSTGYEIYSFDEKLYSGTAEENIYTGDISGDGAYCLVTADNGYLSTLYAYNKSNNRIFKYSFSEYYITAVAMNSDGSGCVAAGISAENGTAKSGVYVLDFAKEEPVSSYAIQNDTLLECEYISGDTAVLVGSEASYIVKSGAENYTTVDYEGASLANYCFNPDTSSFVLALSPGGDGRSVSLVGYNSDGEKLYTIATEQKADCISVYKSTVALLDGNTVYGYNQNGGEYEPCDAGTGAQKIVLTSDDSAYVLSVNQIRQIKLENFQDAGSQDSAG